MPTATSSTTRTEPIAADARPGKDGKNNAKLKLIAGVLGVGFDALRRREAQRRTRRLVAIASAATVGMIAATALAAYALVQRAAAQRQSVRAEAEAETAKQTTKFLVDLFRISDPSEARGNTVTAREMLDKGAARIDVELSKQPVIQATLLDTVGTVYMGLGLYQQARPLLERAVSTRRALLESDPIAGSDSLNHLGDVLTLQAEFAAAVKTLPRVDRPAAVTAAEQGAAGHTGAEPATVWAWRCRTRASLPEAEQQLRAALAIQRRVFGETNGEVGAHARGSGPGGRSARRSQGGDPADAERRWRSSASCAAREPHPDLAEALNNLAFSTRRRAITTRPRSCIGKASP